MAFDPADLRALNSTVPGFTLWHYRTTDGFDEVLAEGYFAPLAEGHWEIGDRILLHAGAWSDHPCFGDLVISHVGRASMRDYIRAVALPQLQL